MLDEIVRGILPVSNFSTELVHLMLRNWAKRISVPSHTAEVSS